MFQPSKPKHDLHAPRFLSICIFSALSTRSDIVASTLGLHFGPWSLAGSTVICEHCLQGTVFWEKKKSQPKEKPISFGWTWKDNDWLVLVYNGVHNWPRWAKGSWIFIDPQPLFQQSDRSPDKDPDWQSPDNLIIETSLFRRLMFHWWVVCYLTSF